MPRLKRKSYYGSIRSVSTGTNHWKDVTLKALIESRAGRRWAPRQRTKEKNSTSENKLYDSLKKIEYMIKANSARKMAGDF